MHHSRTDWKARPPRLDVPRRRGSGGWERRWLRAWAFSSSESPEGSANGSVAWVAISVDAREHFDPPLGILQQAVALLEQSDAFFVASQRFGQADLTLFELVDDGLEFAERFLEAQGRLGGRRWSWLGHN